MHYDDNPFSQEYESACIAQTQSSAVRRDGELLLKLSNGASKIYKDDTTGCENGPDENCKGYTLYDYFPEHRLFLLRVGHHEGGNWLLVSQLDGKEEQIVGPPGYSPSRKWLASANWNEGPGAMQTTVSILSRQTLIREGPLSITDPATMRAGNSFAGTATIAYCSR